LKKRVPAKVPEPLFPCSHAKNAVPGNQDTAESTGKYP
jgi:hypothetical protein